MKNRLLFAVIVVALGFLLCCSPKLPLRLPEGGFGPELAPPLGVRVATNLYYDKREVSVGDWQRYLYWVRAVYGSKSPQFKAALPVTSVWKQPYRCLEPMEKAYFAKQAYTNYPIVGISRAQALAYAQWRADRIMEIYLVTSGIIPYHIDPGRRNHFTIQRYLSGRYRWFKPHPGVTHFLHYRLPSAADWTKAKAHNDSILLRYQQSCREDCEEPVNAGQNPCVMAKVLTLPIVRANTGLLPDSLDYIRHLQGNVGEWSVKPGYTLGGSWFDSKAEVAQRTLFLAETPNAWTGFRLVGEWRKVVKY